jgi:pyruvate,orthophosphate dikinase
MTTHPSVVPLNGTTGLDRHMLGGKAWGIDRMLSLGIPVPPAFALTTDICRDYYQNGKQVAAAVWDALPHAMAELERITGRTFGGCSRPLLVSVRSGAATSMPGMMDTVLNLGMTDEVERVLAKESGDPHYAKDTRRRFLEQFDRAPPRSFTTTRAPWAASSSAYSRPRPPPAPVTMTTRSSTPGMVSSSIPDPI